MTGISLADSPLARIFRSPTDSRLRVGWRLLLHGGLSLALVLGLNIPVAIGIAVLLAFEPELDPLQSLPVLVASSAASLLAICLATWIARRLLDRRSMASLGLGFDRHTLPDLGIGFALPGLLFGATYLFERWMGWSRFSGWAWETTGWIPALAALVGGLALHALVGIQEELLSRGYHLQNLAESFGWGWGVCLSSIAFALLHLPNPGAGLASVVGIFAAGWFLAFGWLRTGRLWLSIGLHAGWNFFEGPFFGFPVSGFQPSSLIRHTVEGPAWVTGGAFGPEAGAVVLPAMLLGAALIWLYTRGRKPAPQSGSS